MAEPDLSPSQNKSKIPRFSSGESSDSDPVTSSGSSLIPKLSPSASSSLQFQNPRDGSSSTDHLASLPAYLHAHILSFLPFKCAVRTSAISSQWRHLYKSRADNLSFVLDSATSPAKIELSIAGGSLRLDSLHLTAVDDYASGLLRSRLPSWLSLAANRSVQDIVLSLPAQLKPDPEPLPELPIRRRFRFGVFRSSPPPPGAILFDFPISLTRLTLIGPYVVHPSTYVRYAFLEVLTLHRVRIGSMDMREVVSCCPVLRSLDVRHCRGLLMLAVPPNAGWCLRSVTVVECEEMQAIHVGRRRNLLRRFHYSGNFLSDHCLDHFHEFAVEDVYLSCGERGAVDGAEAKLPVRRWWWSARALLPHVKVLTLCSLSLRYVAAKGDFCHLPCLKEVQLLMKKMTRSNFMDIFSFFKLCFSPGLEKLFIELPLNSDVKEFSEEFSNILERLPAAGIFDSLRIIKMNRFSGCPYQMLLVQILLWNAIHLETLLLVTPHGYLGEAAEYSMDCHSQALHSICRKLDYMVKSENAKILVTDHDDHRVLPTHYEIY